MMCHGGCGILVHVDNGRVIKVEGDPSSPISKGWLCAKGLASVEHLYEPNRLTHPMKRVGERGKGNWARISWEEALDTVAEKLNDIKGTSGPEAIAVGSGTRGNGFMAAKAAEIFCYVMGSPNHFGSGMAQCFTPRYDSSIHTYGAYGAPDFEGNPKCIVEWGDQLNVSNHNSLIGVRLLRACKPDVKLITIDPRRTAMAARSDVWLRIRPGTDVALALSWMNVILSEHLYDRRFVERWTNAPFLVRSDTGKLLTYDQATKGVNANKFVVWDTQTQGPEPSDAAGVKPSLTGVYNVDGVECKPVWQLLIERAAEYNPEKAEKITWVPANDIRAAAVMYASSKPATISWGVGLDHCVNTHQNARAICVLGAMTGNLDVPGGNVFVNQVSNFVSQRDYPKRVAARIIPPEMWDKQLGADRYKLFAGRDSRLGCLNPALLRSIITGEPYRIRAWLIFGANPILGWANTRQVYEALKKVEFLVIGDYYPSATAQFADILLPCATDLEKDRWNSFSAVSVWDSTARKVVEPMGECKDEFEIFYDLARRLGLNEQWPWKTAKDFYDELLRPARTSWEKVCDQGGLFSEITYRKYETDYFRKGGGFATPSGRVEIFCARWKDLGYDPLPSFTEPPESPYSRPDLAKEYPFVLTTGGRVPVFFHTEYHQIRKLRRAHPFPLFQIHPETATKLGVKNGDWCWIESPRGRCKQKAQLFDGIDPRVIHVEHDWWYPERPGAEPDLYGVWESNVNLLTPNDTPLLDPGYGGATFRGLLCKVERCV